MISSDDHSPPDPQKSHDFKIDSNEKASSSASASDLDLFKSLIAAIYDTNNPLPSFSIRDYAFNSRSKDVACNWPFSHKTLQICLQHGTKNLLPPFQSLESLRVNSSVEHRNSDHEEIITNSNQTPIVDHFVSVTSYDAMSSSSGSKGDKDAQTHLQEDIYLTCTKSKKTTAENTTIQNTIRKCRLATKLSMPAEPVKEVCPVCKTFSSSSNTTLNAHIDQCLSKESSMKWAANPKVIIKHRIKPRKTRLMVDIYKTAPHCTVEELDARNGTSWANNSSFPYQELEFQGDEEKEKRRETAVVPEVADHEGAVYIDTYGTKVRILSVPQVGTSDDHGARKLQKSRKVSRFFTEKKNKILDHHKHQQKYLKLSPKPKPNHGASSEVMPGREEDAGKELMNHEVLTKMDDLPIVRPPRACSKQTGPAKKFRGNINLTHNAPKTFSECVSRTPPRSSIKMGTSSPNKEQPNKAMKLSPLGHYAKKRSPLLTKPSSNHLKKVGRLLQDSCVDPSDVKSKGGKFSSSGKKSSSVSRSESTSKLTLKRKFSALKRSCVHRLPKRNVVAMDPSQDSVKQQSRAEKDTDGKTSSESMDMNLLEVRKKDKTMIPKENSVASKSSKGDFSALLKTDIVHTSCDVESIRKENRWHVEQISTVQVTGSSMDLSNSLNPDNMFNLQEHDDDKVMYCADFIEKVKRIDDVTDNIERKQNYFQDVDPIPVPEPPGSFLPSPGREPVYEELQGNSSFADTSRFHSSEDQHYHDTMDRDSMSDSPISAISNPILARSVSDKCSIRSTSLKDDTMGFSGAMVDAINGNYAHITSANAGDWRPEHMIFTEKGPTLGYKNDQPCCCSRKESAFSKTVASNYHDWTLLRKHAVELLNFQPQASPAPAVVSPPAIKLSAYSNCNSGGSSSKSVLRLMGKNLTVVKTDEDVFSSQKFDPQVSLMAPFPNVQNEYNFSSLGYHDQHPILFSHNQNGFKSQHPNNVRLSHALDTTFRNRFDGQMVSERNMHKAPSKAFKEIIIIDDSQEEEGNGDVRMRRNCASFSSSIRSHNHMHYGRYPSQNSIPFSNGSSQMCSPFMEVADKGNLGKWNCAPAGSPSTSHLRSSAMYYYPPSFHE